MRFTMLFFSLFSITALIYGAMALWTLPAITAAADGMAPFDLRLFGYSYTEAHAFLSALSPEGRDIYLGPQQFLDRIFPGAMALTLCLIFNRLQAGPGALFGAGLALMGAIADYFENMAIARLLIAPLPPSGVLVDQANQWTVIKTVSSGSALILLCGLAGVAYLKHLAQRKTDLTDELAGVVEQAPELGGKQG